MILRCYKVTPRMQNAKAYVNAAILCPVRREQNQLIVTSTPLILIGGVGENFGHASQAERALNGKNLNSPQTLQAVMEALDKEVNPADALGNPSGAYRKHLAKALVYKV